jgi:hypothetical protein
VTGAPVVQGYCHCGSCRAWTAQPVTAYALWPAPKVAVIAGAEHMASAPRNDTLSLHYCARCGGNLMTQSSSTGLFDVYPMILDGFDFAPQAHVNYGERVLAIRDGLPKFRDMPDTAGGSGEIVAE